jgi:hypothetical protein
MKFTFTDGPMAGQNVTLDRGSYYIGREVDNDLLVDDASLSRYHCRVFHEDGGWWIEDLDSMNGVLVNGRKISKPARLHADSAVNIGSETRLIIVRTDNAKSETAPAKAMPDAEAIVGESGAVASESETPKEKEAVKPAPVIERPPPPKTEALDPGDILFTLVAAAAIVLISLGLLAVNMDSFDVIRGNQVAKAPAQPKAVPKPVPFDVLTPQTVTAGDASVPQPPSPATKPVVAKVPAPVADVKKPQMRPSAPRIRPPVKVPADSIDAATDKVAEADLDDESIPIPKADKPNDKDEQLAKVIDNAPDPLDRSAVKIPKHLLPPEKAPRRAPIVADAPASTPQTIRIDPLLNLQFGDQATLLRMFDEQWRLLASSRPDMLASMDQEEVQRLRTRALVQTVRDVNNLESGRRTTIQILNTQACWNGEQRKRGNRPLVIFDWTPTTDLQMRYKFVSGRETHVIELRHEMKGYDYGLEAPGRRFVYRLTVLLNNQLLEQREFDLAAMPEAQRRSAIVEGLDLPSHMTRTPANTLFRYYSDVLSRLDLPGYKVSANAMRRPIQGDFITRIPDSAWDLDSMWLTIEKRISYDDWRNVIREAIGDRFSTSRNQVALH